MFYYPQTRKRRQKKWKTSSIQMREINLKWRMSHLTAFDGKHLKFLTLSILWKCQVPTECIAFRMRWLFCAHKQHGMPYVRCASIWSWKQVFKVGRMVCSVNVSKWSYVECRLYWRAHHLFTSYRSALTVHSHSLVKLQNVMRFIFTIKIIVLTVRHV